MGADAALRARDGATRRSDALASAARREEAGRSIVRTEAVRRAAGDALALGHDGDDGRDAGSAGGSASERGALDAALRRAGSARLGGGGGDEPRGPAGEIPDADGPEDATAAGDASAGGRGRALPEEAEAAGAGGPAPAPTRAARRGAARKAAPARPRTPAGAAGGDVPAGRAEGPATRVGPAPREATWRARDAMRALQARRNQDASRAIAARRGAWAAVAVPGAAARPAAHGPLPSPALRAAAALAAGPASMLALGAVALCVAVAALVGYPAAEAASPGGGERLVAVAMAEYESGRADGTYHYGDHARYGGPEGLWCAAFVSWCADRAGYVEDGTCPSSTESGAFVSYYRSHPERGSVHEGDGAYVPSRGDLFVRNLAGDDGEHVGIVTSSSPGGVFTSVEGNTSGPLGYERDGLRGAVNVRVHSVLGDGCSYTFASPSYPAGGSSVLVPEYDGAVRLGTHGTREVSLETYLFPSGTAQRQVQELWRARGGAVDARGFDTLDGRYLVAVTTTFGSVGDEVVFSLDDGSELACVVVDEKSQAYVPWDHSPANRWGHAGGANIIEFCGRPSIGDDPYVALGLAGRRVVAATNLGPYA